MQDLVPSVRPPPETSRRPPPLSCDTFVYVAGEGGPAHTIFGKNSDRPAEEQHEVVFFPRSSQHPPNSTVRCTHIEIPQCTQETLAVVLSRPSWLWGCEMGANEHGVVGGNEAVSSLLCDELGTEPRLLGMDLLRLALERGKTALQAVDVLIELLEKHGQGGACADDDSEWTYENGFLFADSREAYVVETAGVRHWAVERVGAGKGRNISNGLSIREPSRCSASIKEICVRKNWWDGATEFDWKASVGTGGRGAHGELEVYGREKAGALHLAGAKERVKVSGLLSTSDGTSDWLKWMMGVLRDEQSGICFRSVLLRS